MRFVLRGKIHRATITERHPDYVGSIVVDSVLLKQTDIWPGERVLVSDADNGARFETYIFEGEPNSGIISVNGGAAHLVNEGDKVIIMAFELTDHPIDPKVIIVDGKNKFVKNMVYGHPSTPETPRSSLVRPSPSSGTKRLRLYSDGGSRGNPGKAAYAFLICSEDDKIVKKGSRFLGTMTNNEAEYHGLIAALKEAVSMGATHVSVTMDSELVVKQVKGEYRMKAENLRPLLDEARDLLKHFAGHDIRNVPRENEMISKADELVNEELDLMSQKTKL
ncbi:MAG: aspartate 1-decarboxylase [Methanomassiliicoccales archaeon]|jgi:L-aspartate-alpha-decarboxylase